MKAAPASPRVLLVALCGLISAVRGPAIVDESTRFAIDFTDSKDAAAKATWLDPEKIAVSASGLGWDGSKDASRDGWIHTKPIALGYTWRTAHSIHLRAVISPAVINRVSDTTTTVSSGTLYVRYSPDLRHWSSWQALEHRFDATLASEKRGEPGLHFSGQARIPKHDRQEYERLLTEYRQMDVPFQDDEEAAVKWMLGRDPDLFARQIPFIGYVEFLYETHFVGGRRVRNLDVEIRYTFGGHLPRLRDGSSPNHRAPWRYQDASLSPPMSDSPPARETPAR